MNSRNRSDSVDAPSHGETLQDRFTSDEVYLRAVKTAEEEITRSFRPLFLSGIAAGLTAGASLLASFPVRSALSETPAATIVGAAFYGLGFVFIIIGRYQLFTENTITPVMLALHRKCTLPQLFRLWGIVLAGNLVGAALVALMLHLSDVFSEESSALLIETARASMSESTNRLFWTSVFAGALVGTMAWLSLAVRENTARIILILLIAFVIPIAHLHHCVFGSAETLYAVFRAAAAPLDYPRFLALTVLG
ncbi:MAG: formate/nitrite transporter family protein, partial [Planctomycetota bacterium]|nr:formate/nitrite transporter family protein [Planctomycetota bacterium]